MLASEKYIYHIQNQFTVHVTYDNHTYCLEAGLYSMYILHYVHACVYSYTKKARPGVACALSLCACSLLHNKLFVSSLKNKMCSSSFAFLLPGLGLLVVVIHNHLLSSLKLSMTGDLLMAHLCTLEADGSRGCGLTQFVLSRSNLYLLQFVTDIV